MENEIQICYKYIDTIEIIINCPEIITKIFENIDMTTYLNVMLVSKTFYSIGKEILPYRTVKKIYHIIEDIDIKKYNNYIIKSNS